MFHKFSLIWGWFVWLATFFIPDFPLSMRFRGWLYSFAMKECGKNFQVASSCRILGLDTLSVGDDVYCAPNVCISGGGEIRLSSEVMIGIGSVVVAGNHTMIHGSYRFGVRMEKSIYVGRGSWVSANCTVLGGAYIPESTLIAANAAVVGRLDEAGIWGGVPAKLLRRNTKG